ncbi:MAG: SMI1/KNR4 family protein [Proteobacteria bacterium]|nr:SMI1/KNR4 family protein [Pseudomonadota bacterium]
MRRAAQIWRVPAFEDYVRDPLDGAAVAAVEAGLGVRLPEVYVDALRHQNGGYLRMCWPGSPSDRIYGIGEGYPNLGGTAPWWKDGWDGWTPADPAGLLAIDGDGHWDVCLDYRSCGPTGEPSVAFIDNEAGVESQLVPSFAAYLEGLELELPEGHLRLRGPSARSVAAQLAEQLGTTVPEPARGSSFPLFKFGVGKKEWVWVSPNLVPASFHYADGGVVVSSRRALRFPDDPLCTAVVECTPATVNRLHELVGQ